MGQGGGLSTCPICVCVWASLQLLSLFAVVVCSSFSCCCCCCMWRLSVEVVVCCCHSWLSVDCVPPLPSPQLFACLLPHVVSTCVALNFYLALPLLISRCHAFYLHASVHIFTTPFFCFGCGRGRQEKQSEMGGEGGVAGGRVVERRWRVREGLWEGGWEGWGLGRVLGRVGGRLGWIRGGVGTDASRKKGGGKLDLWAGHGMTGRERERGSRALRFFFSGWKSSTGGSPQNWGIRFRSDFDPRPDPDPISIRFRSDFDPISIRFRIREPISIRFRSDSDPRTDFDPISIRFRSDFDPISIRFRSDFDPIPIRFRSDFDPISIRFRSDFDPSFPRVAISDFGFCFLCPSRFGRSSSGCTARVHLAPTGRSQAGRLLMQPPKPPTLPCPTGKANPPQHCAEPTGRLPPPSPTWSTPKPSARRFPPPPNISLSFCPAFFALQALGFGVVFDALLPHPSKSTARLPKTLRLAEEKKIFSHYTRLAFPNLPNLSILSNLANPKFLSVTNPPQPGQSPKATTCATQYKIPEINPPSLPVSNC